MDQVNIAPSPLIGRFVFMKKYRTPVSEQRQPIGEPWLIGYGEGFCLGVEAGVASVLALKERTVESVQVEDCSLAEVSQLDEKLLPGHHVNFMVGSDIKHGLIKNAYRVLGSRPMVWLTIALVGEDLELEEESLFGNVPLLGVQLRAP